MPKDVWNTLLIALQSHVADMRRAAERGHLTSGELDFSEQQSRKAEAYLRSLYPNGV